MPHIATAMHRSVRRGLADIFIESLLGKRSIEGEVSSVKNTFSSWGNCMKASYCKWPVIIAIIVASLMVFSILWCIIRCACCGMSCCCSCFSFLKCCDCCGGCCDGKRDRPHKHLDDPYSFAPPRQGYQAPGPMVSGGLGGKPSTFEPPQYAQFEVGKNGLAVDPKPSGLSEDALPPMPSWDTATSKHVLTEEEKNAVELGELDPATGQKVPLMSGAAGAGLPSHSGPPSPVPEMPNSPYGARPGQGIGGNGYMGVAGDPYAQHHTAFNGNGRGYGDMRSSSPGVGVVRPGQGYVPPSPQELSAQGNGYGPPSPQDYAGSSSGFGGAAAGAYGRAQPQRQYSSDNGGRPFPPQQPSRQYSSDSSRPLNPGRQYSDRPYPSDNYQNSGPRRPPRGPPRMTSPPSHNTGFDFDGDEQQYSSRPPPPQQMPYGPSQGARSSPPLRQGGGGGGYYNGSTAPPSYASRSPPPQEPGYSGYRPYAPTSSNQGGGEAPRSLAPGGGRSGRDQQGWDPVQR